MSQPLNILLLVEDDENDIIITKRKIVKSNIQINELLITSTLKDTKALLEKKPVDVILLDLNLPDSQGLDTLDEVRSIYTGIIVVLTSIDDELVGIEAIRKGADEYLVKNQISEKLLANSIYHAIERQKRWARVCRVHETLDKIQTMMG